LSPDSIRSSFVHLNKIKTKTLITNFDVTDQVFNKGDNKFTGNVENLKGGLFSAI
jgi:hypothetical protein